MANSTHSLPNRGKTSPHSMTKAARRRKNGLMFKALPLDEFPIEGPLPIKAALFALPVIIHPQLRAEHFPAAPLLPAYEVIVDGLAQEMAGEDGAQGVMILDRLMSPSWLAKACSDGNEMDTATKLVLGHYMEAEDPHFTLENYVSDQGIEGAKDVLGFIVGALYRQDEDPTPLALLNAQRWTTSALRHRIEAGISVGPVVLRHQVLAPAAADEALICGFEGLCRMYLQWQGAGARVNADFTVNGAVRLDVHTGLVHHEFFLDVATMPPARVERLLARLQGLRHFATCLPGAGLDLGAPRVVH
jgi:hypothetical protein